jgi:hypothetical protein
MHEKTVDRGEVDEELEFASTPAAVPASPPITITIITLTKTNI